MVGVVGTERLDVHVREQLAVASSRLGAQLQEPVELLELADPDRRLHVDPAVVPADPNVVEPGAARVLATLVAEAADELPFLLGVREDDPALARRELLVRVEAEHTRRALRPDRPALVLRAEGLGRILDQSEAMPLADRSDLVELARVAEHVDRDDRLRALGDRRFDGSRIEVPVAWIDVREDRSRTLEDEAVRARGERDRRRDRLVAGAQAGASRQHVQSGGAARNGRDVGRADALGDQLLEAVDRRPERQPPGAQHLEDELLLPLVQQRTRKRYLAEARAQAPAGAGVAYSSHCAQRSLPPRAVSRSVSWISSVIGPTPISTSSTALSGVTSAAVPVMNASSAR